MQEEDGKREVEEERPAGAGEKKKTKKVDKKKTALSFNPDEEEA